jgi:hypothetical protein
MITVIPLSYGSGVENQDTIEEFTLVAFDRPAIEDHHEVDIIGQYRA